MDFKKVCTLVFVLFLTSFAFGQAQQNIKEFPIDNKGFASSLKLFMDDSKSPSAIKSTTDFLEIWDKNGFDPTFMSDVIITTNGLMRLKIRPTSELENYLDALVAIKIGAIDQTKVSNFNKVSLEVFAKDRRNVKDFWNSAASLFAKGNFYESTVRSWNASAKDYTFRFEKEGVIDFNKTDVFHITKGDTISIYNTKGTYYTNSNRWLGREGDVFWTRVGFAKDAAKAVLKKYKIDTKASEYTADSVMFAYPQYLKEPAMGKLTDKVTATHQGLKADYPKFSSYKSVFKLKNVFQNIDFEGGFTLEGSEIKGTGTSTKRAMVVIYKNGKPMVRALSKSFSIDKDKITAARASTSFYLNKDSIYHSSCNFNYIDKGKKLTLSRRDEGVYAAPFSDFYHQIDILVDNIFWNLDEDFITMKTISNAAKDVDIESQFFYNEARMVQLQGILNYNPVVKLGRYFTTNPSASLTEVAGFLGNEPRFVEDMLFTLGRDGFLFYDIESQIITAKPKIIHYDACYTKNEDYDVIKFTSLIPIKPNGKLSLTNYELALEGVDIIKLSDSQKTFIIPKDKKISMLQNRDMVFEGQVHSGRFDFYGKGFTFKYDSFIVSMQNVDSMKFKFPEIDKKSGKLISMKEIQTVIQNVTGTLEIDKPDNKSGKVAWKEYPIFTCKKTSFTYYDKPSIFGGVYKKDKFFFKLDPFVIKRLDDFTAEGLKFPGSLVSADIIPEIRDSLSIQPDYSLGFIKETPNPKGYPLYKGKGIAKNGKIDLSNRGFKGDLEVDYLVSKTISNAIQFFPDSMNANSKSFEIPEEGAGKYPPALGPDVYDHWMPYKDSMYIYKRKSPILVYKGKINFEGYFVLTPEVFMGNGTTKYQELILKSKETYFLATLVTAKQGDIAITSNQSKRNALGATNVNASLDLTQDYAKFKTNSDTSKVSLPSNLFSTTLNQFQFDMKSKEVKFQKLETQKTDQAYFKSDNPVQEELQFTSSNATYNLNTLNLKAENVPFLLIGDAEVTTPNKELTIKKDGEIGAIKDAIIVCSDKNKFHTINHCLVTIFSKNRLTGYGDYTYTDKNKNNYNIFFNDIHTNEFKETVAKGNIADTSKFYLAPAIDYQGSVTLYSTVKNLYFNGYLKPEHPFNARLGTQWVKMQDTVDPQNVLFDLQHPIGMDKKDLFCGNFFSLDSSKAYDLFYGKKKNPKDIAILNVDGYMVYDEKNEAFVVKERNKLFPNKDDDTAYIGSNSAIVDKNRGTFYTEGNYNFNTNYKVFNYQTAGSYTYNFNDKKGVFDLAMIADIPLNDDLYKLMLDSILLGSSAEKEAKLSGNGLLNAFCLMIKDRKDKQKVVNEFSGYGYLTSAELINKALVFSSIKMSFNDSLRAYMSDGPIAIAASKKVGINKYISGVIKIKPNKKQNRVGLLVESSPNGGFHFMEFVGGQAQFLSSDQSFNDLIGTAGPKVSKAGYKVTLATIDDAVRLKNKMPENEDILLKEEQEKKALQEAEEIKLDGSGPTKPKEKVGADAIKIDETEELSDEEKVKLEAKKAAEAEKKAKADEKEAKKKAKKEKKAAEEEAKKKAAEGDGGNANPSDSTQSKPAEIKKEDDSKPKEDGK